MSYTQILKRSWKILWSYPALWIFGIILALTAGASSNNPDSLRWLFDSSRNQPSSPSIPPSSQWGQIPQDLNRAWEQFTQTINAPGFERTLIGIVIGLLCLALIIGILFAIGKYVSRVGLIRMVDGHETTGEKASWRKGFRLGWSKAAWRLFLIDLVIGLPIAVVFIIMVGIAILPVMVSLFAGGSITLVSIIPTIGLVFLLIFLIAVVSLLLALVMEVIWRACVLGNSGVFDAIRLGWQMVRRNLKHVFFMWLILVGISIAYGLATIPVTLILLVVGVVLGGGAAVVLFIIVQTAAGVTTGLITALIVGGLLFILALALPLLFLGGLKQTYFSSAWTLFYRELKLQVPEAPIQPVVGDAGPSA
jgi:hypothetical protein